MRKNRCCVHNSFAQHQGSRAERIVFGEDNFEVEAEEDEHGHVVGLGEIHKVCRMDALEPEPKEELTEHVPSIMKSIRIRRGLIREDLTTSQSKTPAVPESLLCLGRQRDFRVRICRCVAADTPLPEGRKGKPPHLASFLKGKILERVLPVFGLAGKEILIIGEVRPLENARPGKQEPVAEKPPSRKRLDFLHRSTRRAVDNRPQNRSPTSSMAATERVSSECSGFTLQEASLLPDRRTSDHCCVDWRS